MAKQLPPKPEVLTAEVVEVNRRDPVTNLTGPEEVYCLQVVRTGNCSAAFRLAFPDHVCLETREKEKAKLGAYLQRLNKDPRIKARLEQLREVVRTYTGISLFDHVATLQELRVGAVGAQQFGPAVAAEVSRGKVSGLYVEKVEHSGVVNIVASTFDEGL